MRTSSSSQAHACSSRTARSARSQAWDFVQSPAGTEHVIVGAAVAPSIVLSVGRRQDTPEDGRIRYPVSELAAKYGASAHKETTDPNEAYAGFEHPTAGSTRGRGSTAVGNTARLRAASRNDARVSCSPRRALMPAAKPILISVRIRDRELSRPVSGPDCCSAFR